MPTRRLAAGRFDFRTLEIAAAVIETRGMAQVATRFGVTQSAVSQAVRRAEALVGTALLERRRPLTATPAGQVLAEQVRTLSLGIAQALDAARAAADRPARLALRLGMIDTVAGTIGAQLLRGLLEGATALRLSAWSGLAFSHTDALLRHAIDAAITCDAMEDLAEMERHGLFREPFILLVPKDRMGGLEGLGLPEILAGHRLIRHSARSAVGAQVERHLRRLGLDPAQVLEFDTSDALLGMVGSGVGVAITTPLCLLQAAAGAAAAHAMPLPGPGFTREVLLVSRPGELGALAGRLADLARGLFASHALPGIHALAPWLSRNPELRVLNG